MSVLKRQYGVDFVVLATRPGGRKEEKLIHDMFADIRFPRTEQFVPTGGLIGFIGVGKIDLLCDRPIKPGFRKSIVLHPEVYRLLCKRRFETGKTIQWQVHESLCETFGLGHLLESDRNPAA